ncbi:glutamine synthetase [Leucobacter sp. wl10]|uniref:glutamine synthetase n=1 Tax=Leucobacter sp. wl10 TaxID=2304677 RepID=UPI000E5AC4A7|nr:glutamine synthetase [Leucobacter sp. wl10]RGE23114.1 glutamine synthetase [Leucobacter sp. wl10]
MRKEPLSIILTSDLAAKARGRAFPQQDFQKYLNTGCGWVPANLAIDAFGSIVTPNPFGSVGDLRLMPDVSSIASLALNDSGEQTTMVLADIHTPDGKPWDCDPRTFLKQAIADLKQETGLSVVSSFEHEFMLLVNDERPVNTPFSLESYLEEEELGGRLIAALDDAGLEPEMWLPEFGRNQFEVTVAPSPALVAADRAVYLREITRHVASSVGKRITFSPIIEENGGGNGVHIHVSLRDEDERFVTYDPSRPGSLSEIAGSFAAGILQHAEAIQAIAASAPISYERLVPNHWSAGGVFLGENNREAMLRICPLFNTPGANHQKQYNLEYRAADATSNPWLVLGCLIRAGLEGIRAGLDAPNIVQGESSRFTEAERQAHGIRSIPASLEEALRAFETSEVARGWFSTGFAETFLSVKRAEIRRVEGMETGERYAAYAATY